MKAELLSIYGDDLMIANVARVSYGKESTELSEEEEKLINYLWKHKHTSPFRHPQIQFRITCPIFVERQLFKHQVGLSANSISGRYVDFSDSYFDITELRMQSKDSKQGSSEERVAKEIEEQLIYQMNDAIENCKKVYDTLIESGVAKEQARIILPLALNTTFIWTGSLLSFLHLFDLRLKPDAQKETRTIAQQMLDLLEASGNFKFALGAWKSK